MLVHIQALIIEHHIIRYNFGHNYGPIYDIWTRLHIDCVLYWLGMQTEKTHDLRQYIIHDT